MERQRRDEGKTREMRERERRGRERQGREGKPRERGGGRDKREKNNE
jgi:hypothetical protein